MSELIRKGRDLELVSIAILINSLQGGGAERVARDVANHLVNVPGVEVHLFTLGAGQVYEVDPSINRKMLAPSWLPRRTPLFRLLAFTIAFVRLVFLIRRHRISSVLSVLQEANYLNILAKSVAGHAAVTSIHSILDVHYRVGLGAHAGRWLVRRLLPHSSHVIAVSQGAADGLRRLARVTDIHVIPNPFDIPAIRTMSGEHLEPDFEEVFQNPVIITVGNLRQVKGQWHLIRSFAKVRQDIRGCKLVILGDGPLRNHLESLAEDLGVRNDVYLPGWKPNPFRFVRRATVFAMTSISESMTMSLIEAMICDIPVVSTDCVAGPREILAPGTSTPTRMISPEFAQYGILTPPVSDRLDGNQQLSDPEIVLADALTRMLLDADLRSKYSTLGRKRAQDFDIVRIGAEYESLLVGRKV